MKKLLFMAAVAVFGLTGLNAQDDSSTGGFENGDLYVSGSVGFNSFKAGEAKSNSFNFSPSAGYFISDNIALELGLEVGSTKDADDDKTSSFGVNLGGRYFFTPSNQFSFTVGAALSFGSNKEKPDGGDEAKSTNFGFAVSPGINYFVSDAFALRASVGALGFRSDKADGADEAATSFGLNMDLSTVNFGLTYKF